MIRAAIVFLLASSTLAQLYSNPVLTEPIESLPDSFSWQSVNGRNYLTYIRNQHIPVYCGSCWAQAATSALSDRIKILRNASFPDILISA
jgi:cathepsin X